jgi:2-iminobutanoate/2-iminopropanoate deaminase
MTDATTPQPVATPNAPPVAGPYSAAVRAGDWLVLAGQVPLDPATGKLVDGDAAAQCRQVFANITAVLGDCGATLADVAKATVFVTDLGDFAAMNAVYAEAFGDHKPARSTVQVAGLPAGASVEIEVWVFQPAGS